ncbi:biotin/lipoyl-binding protein, partial [Poseidonocella sedimentorum]
VMLLLFTPLPYADLSSAWTFRNKWRRAAVGAAGMYADAISCAVATLLWAHSPPGAINEIALNVMFVTAVYTLFFNSNPLMRFDGYFILSDLVEIPNLHQAAKSQFNARMRLWLLREPLPPEARVSPRRVAFLIGFFVVSNVYRIMIMAGIVIFIADQYFGLGLVVAAALVLNAFVLPLVKLVKPLASPHFRRKHARPLRIMALVGAGLIALLVFLPVPDYRRLSGVVAPLRSAQVLAPAAGVLRDAPLRTGDRVAPGDLIARLENPELDLQLENLEARLRGAELRAVRSRSRASADLAAIEEEIAGVRASLDSLRDEARRLTLRATRAGVWRDAGLTGRRGSWLSQGAVIGEIIEPDGHVFRAVLRQEAAEGVAGLPASAAALKLEGARALELPVTALQLVPYSRRDLPSQSLGSAGGGDLAVRVDTPTNPSAAPGSQAVERFFLLTAGLDLAAAPELGQSALTGRSGWLRLTLAPRPIAAQLWTTVQQFFQKRYKL